MEHSQIIFIGKIMCRTWHAVVPGVMDWAGASRSPTMLREASSIYYVFCGYSLNYWLYPPSNGNGFLFLDPRHLNHVLPPEKNVSCFTQLKAWRIKQNTSLLGISLLVDKVSSCAMNMILDEEA